jgi:hypothetical protein
MSRRCRGRKTAPAAILAELDRPPCGRRRPCRNRPGGGRRLGESDEEMAQAHRTRPVCSHARRPEVSAPAVGRVAHYPADPEATQIPSAAPTPAPSAEHIGHPGSSRPRTRDGSGEVTMTMTGRSSGGQSAATSSRDGPSNRRSAKSPPARAAGKFSFGRCAKEIDEACMPIDATGVAGFGVQAAGLVETAVRNARPALSAGRHGRSPGRCGPG